MQIPSHLSLLLPLLLHDSRRVDTEASKYSRTEFGDRNPSWLLAGASDKSHARRIHGSKKAAPELPKPALVRGGLEAEH